jgi:hypothetical protein
MPIPLARGGRSLDIRELLLARHDIMGPGNAPDVANNTTAGWKTLLLDATSGTKASVGISRPMEPMFSWSSSGYIRAELAAFCLNTLGSQGSLAGHTTLT